MASNPAAVQVQSLDKLFGTRKVLDGLSLTVGQGEFVALLGRSGSGKSTFLRVLGALDAEVSGQVRVPARRAIVFQEPRLLPWQRVLRNITVGLPQDRSTRQRAVEALDEVGLARHAQAWPRTLSGGEAQRAALARALVREPQLILLDEPFGALDALTRLRMHVLLRNLYERHRPAVLLVTHDVDEAMLLADRVLVLTDGHIAFDEPVAIDDPVRRNSPRFAQLRAALLQQLGVAQV